MTLEEFRKALLARYNMTEEEAEREYKAAYPNWSEYEAAMRREASDAFFKALEDKYK